MKLKSFINKYFDSFETIFLLIFASGIAMILLQKKLAIYILGTGTATLAILYWLKAIEHNSDTDKKNRYSQKLVWYSMMIAPLAIFSKLNLYDKSNEFMIFSLVLLSLSLIIRIIQKSKNPTDVPYSDIVRLATTIIIAFFIFTLPLAKI
jgi:lipopolysaccharide export LptBFGC system permease protein LptF